MKSATKHELETAQVFAAVREAFGPSAEPTACQEFSEGWFNTIYDIRLADGRRLVLKLAPKAGVPVLRYEGELLATELAVYRLLAGQPGVPTPAVLHSDPDGRLLGMPCFFMEHLPLPSLAKAKAGMDDAARAAAEADLGRVNRALNAIAGPRFGSLVPGGRSADTWPAALALLFEDLLADARDVRMDPVLPEDRIRRLLGRSKDCLAEVTEPRLVHWDLHDGNAFVDGSRVAAIIDGDRALWGDPLMEVYFSDLCRSPHFDSGYGGDPLGTPSARRRRAVYDLYLALVMRIECDYRHYAAEHRAWTQERLDRCLESSAKA